MKNITAYGLKFAVFNFIIVGIWGLLMRYKVAFSLPFLQQKNLIEAHSHFAFYGWIACAIYFLMLNDLKDRNPEFKLKKYYTAIAFNIIGAFGMLITFTYAGYYWLSIVSSAVCMLSSYAIFFFLVFDYRKNKSKPSLWYWGAMFFAVISSAGVFFLSYTTATEQVSPEIYNASIYYFLHFQYNGFFIFSCIGLLFSRIEKVGGTIENSFNKYIYYLLLIGTLIAYGLSVVWMDLPIGLFAIILLGTLVQVSATYMVIKIVVDNWGLLKEKWAPMQRFILIYVGLAFVLKTFLQLLSNVPSVVRYAFEFRDVSIAYLHLVMLMGVATFLIGEIMFSRLFKFTALGWIALQWFLFFNFFNQAFLGLKAFSSIFHFRMPNHQYIFFGLGLMIILSLTMILLDMKIFKRKIK